MRKDNAFNLLQNFIFQKMTEQFNSSVVQVLVGRKEKEAF